MDFNKPTRNLITPHFSEKNKAPDQHDAPVGADWFAWDLTIGPADGGGCFAPNPMSIIGPGAAMPSLAATLSWKLQK